MPERSVDDEILQGLREIKVYKAGKTALRTHKLKRPASPQRIRASLRLSQSAFAGLMGVSLRTVQDWEQGRRRPSGPAEALLRIAEQHPEVLVRRFPQRERHKTSEVSGIAVCGEGQPAHDTSVTAVTPRYLPNHASKVSSTVFPPYTRSGDFALSLNSNFNSTGPSTNQGVN